MFQNEKEKLPNLAEAGEVDERKKFYRSSSRDETAAAESVSASGDGDEPQPGNDDEVKVFSIWSDAS